MRKYPLVRLQDFLQPRDDEVVVQPDLVYPLAGVYSFGKGLFAKESISGAETSYRTFRRLRDADLVYSRLFAWEGAAAVVSAEFDGYFVSQEFPTFIVDRTKCDPAYLNFICRWHKFHESMAGQTKGLGLRRQRVHPEQFLTLQVPLPDVNEQRRVAGKLDRVTDGLTRILPLRSRTRSLLASVLPGHMANLVRRYEDASPSLVRDLCEPPQYGYTASARWEPVGPRFVRITDMSDGAVEWSRVPFCECESPDQYKLQPGDVLIARTGKAGESCLVTSVPEDSVFASYVIRLRARQGVLPGYLYWFFQTPTYWEQVRRGSRGTAQQNVNGKKLREIIVPLPPEDEQDRIVARMESLKLRVSRLAELSESAVGRREVLNTAALNYAFGGQM